MHGAFLYFIDGQPRRVRVKDCPDVRAARVLLEDILQVPVRFVVSQ